MEFLVIKKSRLLQQVEYDVRKHSRGVLNWFVDENNMLNILLFVQGVNYIYKTSVYDIDEDVKWLLTSDREILGISTIKEFEKVKEPVEETTLADIYKTGVI